LPKNDNFLQGNGKQATRQLQGNCGATAGQLRGNCKQLPYCAAVAVCPKTTTGLSDQ
jgi:hypothetical protein